VRRAGLSGGVQADRYNFDSNSAQLSARSALSRLLFSALRCLADKVYGIVSIARTRPHCGLRIGTQWTGHIDARL
jgi:hypothetical protein